MITIEQLKSIKERTEALYRYLDIEGKKIQVEEEQLRTQAPGFWDDQKAAEAQMKKVKGLQQWIAGYNEIKTLSEELQLAFDFYKDELVTEEEIDEAYAKASTAIDELELKNMLRDEADQMDCVLKINSGAGGTESQDWASMLMRMYLRYAETNGYKAVISNLQEGDEAGIKTCTIEISGDYAYGYLKGENGVHRLVRISPFDANARRHTSFAAVDVMPELDDSVAIDINPADLKVDTYRASGAGGQHVNKTSSAVRMTHLPTGIIVQCQTQRSQIQNRERCLQLLRAKLYEYERAKQDALKSDIAGDYQDIEWGSQIRSYVFQPYKLVKDHRTNAETGNVQAVMDGGLEMFVEAYLRSQQKKL